MLIVLNRKIIPEFRGMAIGILLFFAFIFMTKSSIGQIFNANYTGINFGGAGVTITPKIGDGRLVGNLVLYENVITISGQQIDAIVKTISITNGTYNVYDYTGTSQNNLQSWFSPQLNFTAGGGSIEFRIEFILGGSYNNGTNNGDAVTIQNLVMNSYDIDGNGNANSNQFCDFGGFESSEIGNPTNLEYLFDPATSLTRFRSTLSANSTNAAEEKNRVKCVYSFISILDLKLGGEGNGAAYYFLDFSGGDDFVSSTLLEAPKLDLDTYTLGIDNDTIFMGNPVSFTKGATNVTHTGSSIDNLTIAFTNTMLLDGPDEKIEFRDAGGMEIVLDFSNGQIISDFTIGATTFSVIATVSGDQSELVFTNGSGGVMSLAEVEMLIDAIDYNDVSASPTVANRIFDVTARDGEFESSVAQFNIAFGTSLPVELSSFEAFYINPDVNLIWQTSTETNNHYFSVERSLNILDWEDIGWVLGAGTSTQSNEYKFVDFSPLSGTSYYRLKQCDYDGVCSESEIKSVLAGIQGIQLISQANLDNVGLIFPEDWHGEIRASTIVGEIVFYLKLKKTDARYVYIEHEEVTIGKLIIKCYGYDCVSETFSVMQ